jgi:uncharacterized protein (TIGR02246 family)
MGEYTRDEIEEAFTAYQAAGERAGATGDWAAWADHFTEDAVYIEHHYGRFDGREAIRDWISGTMSTYPGNRMPLFPVEWHVIDEERGWVVCQVWNRMDDPGDGSVHQAANITILHYAGDGRWSYEEDVYNPAHFADMLVGWQNRVKELQGADG